MDSNPERLARFQREAQVLASLNHPPIAHVYGLEEAEGVIALVMELVEGPTLAIAPPRVPSQPDGTVKVLDFGLAKVMQPTGEGETGSSWRAPGSHEGSSVNLRHR